MNFYSTKNVDSQWFIKFEEAQKLSEETGRPILANFTGRDWNDWCKRLDSEVFITPEFREWAQKKVILLELDFPKNKKQDVQIKMQNKNLAELFKLKSLPTVWIFRAKMDKINHKLKIDSICQLGYLNGGPKIFTQTLDIMMENHKDNAQKN
ncbi:MAG: thioredoxin family protein [Limnohabitans sp.]|nr:thioredoxin family protein [Limnohabitans sp.]